MPASVYSPRRPWWRRFAHWAQGRPEEEGEAALWDLSRARTIADRRKIWVPLADQASPEPFLRTLRAVGGFEGMGLWPDDGRQKSIVPVLMTLAHHRHTEGFQRVLARAPEEVLNPSSEDGYSPLMIAMRAPKPWWEIIPWLLHRGCCVDSRVRDELGLVHAGSLDAPDDVWRAILARQPQLDAQGPFAAPGLLVWRITQCRWDNPESVERLIVRWRELLAAGACVEQHRDAAALFERHTGRTIDEEWAARQATALDASLRADLPPADPVLQGDAGPKHPPARTTRRRL